MPAQEEVPVNQEIPPAIRVMFEERLARDNERFQAADRFFNQRFDDLSLQLQQRFEAQQLSVAAALAAAEKAVTAALTAAEKAVDKAEQAQALRNEQQNEFRQSLSDLSGLMWTIKEGSATVDALRREIGIQIEAHGQRLSRIDNVISALQGSEKKSETTTSSAFSTATLAIAVVAVIVAVASVFYQSRSTSSSSNVPSVSTTIQPTLPLQSIPQKP